MINGVKVRLQSANFEVSVFGLWGGVPCGGKYLSRLSYHRFR